MFGQVYFSTFADVILMERIFKGESEYAMN